MTQKKIETPQSDGVLIESKFWIRHSSYWLPVNPCIISPSPRVARGPPLGDWNPRRLQVTCRPSCWFLKADFWPLTIHFSCWKISNSMIVIPIEGHLVLRCPSYCSHVWWRQKVCRNLISSDVVLPYALPFFGKVSKIRHLVSDFVCSVSRFYDEIVGLKWDVNQDGLHGAAGFMF